MIRLRPVLLVIVALALQACGDSSPVGGEGPPQEAELEMAVEAALDVNDQQGTPLPSLHNLLRRTYEAIRAQGGHEEGVRLLKAGRTLAGIIAVLGPEVVDEALAGVDHALDRVQERFAGKVLPARMQTILAMAEARADAAHAARENDRLAAALGAALASADLIRSLSPRYQARKTIDRATRALNAARQAVGTEPTDDEVTSLKKASRLRKAAVEAFKGKEYRKAWNYAQRSLSFSLEVLKGRSSG